MRVPYGSSLDDQVVQVLHVAGRRQGDKHGHFGREIGVLQRGGKHLGAALRVADDRDLGCASDVPDVVHSVGHVVRALLVKGIFPQLGAVAVVLGVLAAVIVVCVHAL